MNKTPRELLDAIAATRIPDNFTLLPALLQQASTQNRKMGKPKNRIAGTPENRNTFMQTLRAKPVIVVLLVLLSLALLSGVVYAVSRSLGYIPGVGIVEQGAPLRVLAEPVSLTHDGITLTVTSVTLAADKTVITYTIENIPWEAISHQEDVPGCYAEGQIRLPNGSLLVPQSGGGGMSADSKWETRMVYSALPPQFSEAEFLLDCIPETLPGKAPENWKLPLKFIPAPPDLTVVPVIEIPTSAPQAIGESAPSEGLILEKVIETESGYILVGKFRSGNLPAKAQALGFSQWLRVTDANGTELPYRTANDVDAISTTMGEFSWTLEILGKAQAWPLTFHLDAVDAQALDLSAQFTFDAGANPQPGQEWLLGQDVPLGDFTVRVEKVVFTGAGYSFEISAPPEMRGINLDILDTSPLGGGGSDGNGLLTASVDYDQPPTGLLTISLYAPILSLRGPWSLQWQPENAPHSESLYGIRLVLDKFIPLEDGYYLIGHNESDDPRITEVAHNAFLTATDESGRRLALEMASFSETMQFTSQPDESVWVYRLYGKAFQGKVTLRLNSVTVGLAQAAPLTLDLRPFNFSFEQTPPGTPFKTGLIPLDLPGLSAQLYKATVFQQGDLRGFELAFQADPRLEGIVFEMKFSSSGMSGSFRQPDGDLIAQVATDPPPSMLFHLSATGLRLKGDWSLTWTPPAPPPGATPVYAPQACLTLDSVKQALANPPALPPALTGKFLLLRGALAPEPSLFIANLNGSAEIPLAFGQGSLSPDGSRVAYSDENNQLMVMDLSSRVKTILSDSALTPNWSPDGTQIAFLRQTPKGFNLFVIDADGSNLRQLTDSTMPFDLAGWTSDSQAVLLQTASKVELLNLNDGARRTLLETRYDATGFSPAALSPDSGSLAYLDDVPGGMTPGLYLKALPDGEPRLLAQLDYWSVYNPVFSPDGQWLAFSVLDGDTAQDEYAFALNLATCQAFPLPLDGAIQQWLP
jgi:hypothetical protein